MKKKKKRPVVLFLWFIFIVMVAAICYLSFQNGEAAKALGSQVISQLADAQDTEGAAAEEALANLTYLIRQSGRAIAFLMIGIVGTTAIYVTCAKWNWFLKSGIAVVILMTIACLTEKLKIFIPSRHYSYEEMMISIMAAGAGFLAVSLITLLGKLLKGLTRYKATEHSL